MNIEYKFVLLLILILLQGCSAKFQSSLITESRTKLKNYGISYCMSEYTVDKKSSAYIEYSHAQGAYFDTGNHTIESYNKVKEFILSNYEKSYFKNYEDENIFFSCLELYNSNEFNNFIKSLDHEIYE